MDSGSNDASCIIRKKDEVIEHLNQKIEWIKEISRKDRVKRNEAMEILKVQLNCNNDLKRMIRSSEAKYDNLLQEARKKVQTFEKDKMEAVAKELALKEDKDKAVTTALDLEKDKNMAVTMALEFEKEKTEMAAKASNLEKERTEAENQVIQLKQREFELKEKLAEKDQEARSYIKKISELEEVETTKDINSLVVPALCAAVDENAIVLSTPTNLKKRRMVAAVENDNEEAAMPVAGN